MITHHEIDNDPNIENEPNANSVAIFKSKSLSDQLENTSPCDKLQKKSSSEPQLAAIQKQSSDVHEKISFEYFDVMVCDDDSFQHLYYENFFEKKVEYHNPDILKGSVKLYMSFSGSELLSKFKALLDKESKPPLLIITDMNMGENSINGIITAQKLRENGYTGPIILRSSESESHISEVLHKELENGTITHYLEKINYADFKKIVERYV